MTSTKTRKIYKNIETLTSEEKYNLIKTAKTVLQLIAASKYKLTRITTVDMLMFWACLLAEGGKKEVYCPDDSKIAYNILKDIIINILSQDQGR